MALSLGNIAIGAEGLYIGDILIGADNAFVPPVIPATSLFVEWIVVGGGGGGGFKGQNVDWYAGGGGGGGGVVTGSTNISVNSTIQIDLGAGGGGGDTFDTATVVGGQSRLIYSGGVGDIWTGGGGGRGGTGNDNTPGTGDAFPGQGGSGGGGASYFSEAGTLIFNTAGATSDQISNYGHGWGQTGCNGGTSFATKRGGSGGSGEPTSNPNCPFPDTGFTWVDGIAYAQGGSSDTTDAQAAGKGNGGNCNNDGSVGVAVIRYAGTTQRATGGTVTTSGGYTYHTFGYTGDDQYFENIT
jgi:hypothetical protein